MRDNDARIRQGVAAPEGEEDAQTKAKERAGLGDNHELRIVDGALDSRSIGPAQNAYRRPGADQFTMCVLYAILLTVRLCVWVCVSFDCFLFAYILRGFFICFAHKSTHNEWH